MSSVFLKRAWNKLQSRANEATAIPSHLELEMDPRPAIRFGVGLIVGVLGIFLLWALLAPLDQGVVAPGVVNVDTNRKTIQHQKGGTVKEILVRDGVHVRRGDVLLRLDDTQWLAGLDIEKDAYWSARAIEARLTAERDQLDRIVFPEELLGERNDPRIEEILHVQSELFEARRRALAGELAVYQENIAGLVEHISGLEGLEQNKAKQINLFNQELDSLQKLLEKGHVARTQIFEVQRAIASLTGERSANLSEIAATRKNIAELKLKMLYRKQDFLREVETELESIKQEAIARHQRMLAAQYDMEHSVITAPVDGVVMGMAIHTVGGVVRPGDDIMFVIPEGERMVLQAQIRPQDIDKVKVGLKADVRLTAFNQSTTPVVEGEVVMVSADSTEDRRTGMRYYSGRVVLTEQSMVKLGGLAILPGMPADIIIKTGERTFMNYLLKPFTDRMARAFKE
jgi:HlyD family type I secretion membrane fusion protein